MRTVTLPDCAYGALDSETTAVLTGDSHAAQWLPALERVAERRGWRLVAITKSACPFVDVTAWNGPFKRPYRECDRFRKAMEDRIAALRPEIVFVANARVRDIVVDGRRTAASDARGVWFDGLGRELRRVGAHAKRVVLLADTPRHGFDPLDCLATASDAGACTTARAEAVDAAWALAEARAAEAAGARVVSADAWICPADPCPVVIDGVVVYLDPHHVSARFMAGLTDRIDEAISSDANGANSPKSGPRSGGRRSRPDQARSMSPR
jgi:hypothetical protein